jgi:hypothetical protein
MTDRGTIEEQIHDAKFGVSVLVACLVQEIEASNPGFQGRYLERLGEAYARVRERDTPALDRLELIGWTRELLTGFNIIDGQGAPFLENWP